MRRTIKSEDSSNIKRDTYVLKAADPFFDCDDGIKINHILKFHPGDKEALDHYGHEWLLRRDVPPKPEENENKPRRKSKYYENTGLEPDQVAAVVCAVSQTILSGSCISDLETTAPPDWA